MNSASSRRSRTRSRQTLGAGHAPRLARTWSTLALAAGLVAALAPTAARAQSRGEVIASFLIAWGEMPSVQQVDTWANPLWLGKPARDVAGMAREHAKWMRDDAGKRSEVVRRSFQVAFGREPGDGELAWHGDRQREGLKTFADMISGHRDLIRRDEATRRGVVENAYRTVFADSPDDADRADWMQALARSGMLYAEAVKSLRNMTRAERPSMLQEVDARLSGMGWRPADFTNPASFQLPASSTPYLLTAVEPLNNTSPLTQVTPLANVTPLIGNAGAGLIGNTGAALANVTPLIAGNLRLAVPAARGYGLMAGSRSLFPDPAPVAAAPPPPANPPASPAAPSVPPLVGRIVDDAPTAFTFGQQTVYGWGNGATNAFAGDFDGDGRWDIGVTGTAAEPDRYWYIRYGDGRGQFGRQTVYGWGNGVTNAFSGDFDGDGRWDIGVTGTAAQSDRYWYVRYGDGRGQFGRQTAYWWGNGATKVVTGDFNGDRRWDIGVVELSAGRATVYLRFGNGTGQFGSQAVYAWDNCPGDNFIAGDFNGDGFTDLCATGSDARPNGGRWFVRLNDRRGSFPSEVVYPWGNGANNIFAGDFNGDRRWDIGVTGTRERRDGNWWIRYCLPASAASAQPGR